jgi:hypothetical protein
LKFYYHRDLVSDEKKPQVQFSAEMLFLVVLTIVLTIACVRAIAGGDDVDWCLNYETASGSAYRLDAYVETSIIVAAFLSIAGIMHFKREAQLHRLGSLTRWETFVKSFLPGFSFGSEMLLMFGIWTQRERLPAG